MYFVKLNQIRQNWRKHFDCIFHCSAKREWKDSNNCFLHTNRSSWEI